MRHCHVATFHRPALAISTDHPEYMPGSYAPMEQQAASSSTPPRISMSNTDKQPPSYARDQRPHACAATSWCSGESKHCLAASGQGGKSVTQDDFFRRECLVRWLARSYERNGRNGMEMCRASWSNMVFDRRLLDAVQVAISLLTRRQERGI